MSKKLLAAMALAAATTGVNATGSSCNSCGGSTPPPQPPPTTTPPPVVTVTTPVTITAPVSVTTPVTVTPTTTSAADAAAAANAAAQQEQAMHLQQTYKSYSLSMSTPGAAMANVATECGLTHIIGSSWGFNIAATSSGGIGFSKGQATVETTPEQADTCITRKYLQSSNLALMCIGSMAWKKTFNDLNAKAVAEGKPERKSYLVAAIDESGICKPPTTPPATPPQEPSAAPMVLAPTFNFTFVDKTGRKVEVSCPPGTKPVVNVTTGETACIPG